MGSYVQRLSIKLEHVYTVLVQEDPKHLGWEGDDPQPAEQSSKASKVRQKRCKFQYFRARLKGMMANNPHHQTVRRGSLRCTPTGMTQNSNAEGVFTSDPGAHGGQSNVAQPILDDFPSSRIASVPSSRIIVAVSDSPSATIFYPLRTSHGACAVDDISKKADGDSDEESESLYAIIDGGAVDNMFNVPEECFKTYTRSKASWGTAKRDNHLRAAGEGKIVIRVEDTRNKGYAIELYAYHVPQLAMNLLSVHDLCQRGYVVEHNLPHTTIRQKGSSEPIFRCPVKGRLWALPFKTKLQPQEEFVFLSVDVPPI